MTNTHFWFSALVHISPYERSVDLLKLSGCLHLLNQGRYSSQNRYRSRLQILDAQELNLANAATQASVGPIIRRVAKAARFTELIPGLFGTGEGVMPG